MNPLTTLNLIVFFMGTATVLLLTNAIMLAVALRWMFKIHSHIGELRREVNVLQLMIRAREWIKKTQ
jgi:hypothetical protein